MHSHVFSLAFSVDSPHADSEDITPATMLRALLRRVGDICKDDDPNSFMEVFMPEDSCEKEPKHPYPLACPTCGSVDCIEITASVSLLVNQNAGDTEFEMEEDAVSLADYSSTSPAQCGSCHYAATLQDFTNP